MARPRLTIDAARHLEFEPLLDATYGILKQYEAPEVEMPDERDRRISRTLDEIPDVYGWFLQLHAYFDFWTDRNAELFGQKSMEYREMREKRDMFKNAASAAKLRYEGASRRVTILQEHEEESRMPRGR